MREAQLPPGIGGRQCGCFFMDPSLWVCVFFTRQMPVPHPLSLEASQVCVCAIAFGAAELSLDSKI